MRRNCHIIIVIISFFEFCLFSNVQSQEISEYEIKAAFLYNFAKFVEWPDELFLDPDAPFVFGVLGNEAFGQVLEQTIGGKYIQGRRLEIDRFQQCEEIEYCHILFIALSGNECIEEIVEKVNRLGVLTVGDMEGFAERGGVVNFFMKENKVRLCINPDAAEQANLKISSKLLNVSQIVN